MKHSCTPNSRATEINIGDRGFARDINWRAVSMSVLIWASCINASYGEPLGTLAHWSFEGVGNFGSSPNGYSWFSQPGWGGKNITEVSAFSWNVDNIGPATTFHASGTGVLPYRYTSTTSRIAGTHSALVLRARAGLPTAGFILPGALSGTGSPRHDIYDNHHDRSQWTTGLNIAGNVTSYFSFSMKIASGDTFEGPWCLFAQVHPIGGPPVFQIQPGTLPGESTSTATVLYAQTENTGPLSNGAYPRTVLKRSRIRNSTNTGDVVFIRNAWYDFVIKSKFGTNGFVEVWLKRDSEAQSSAWKAWSYTGPVMFTGTNPQYTFLLDVYRGAWKDSAGNLIMSRLKQYTVHFDEVRIADSRSTIQALMPPPR